MSTPTSSSLRLSRTSNSSNSPTTTATIQPPLSTFLTLAPTTSASYPTSQKVASAASRSPSSPPSPSSPSSIEKQQQHRPTRRSSSGASSSEGGGLRRYLKLGPVHFGESSDGEGDWSEHVLVE